MAVLTTRTVSGQGGRSLKIRVVLPLAMVGCWYGHPFVDVHLVRSDQALALQGLWRLVEYCGHAILELDFHNLQHSHVVL